MNCQEILTILELYRVQILELIGPTEKEVEVSSSYSFIQIATSTYRIEFEIEKNNSKLRELYPKDQSLKDKIESTKWPTLNPQPASQKFSDKIRKHLQDADAIAALVVHCTSGDDYRPGNFSKIIYSEKEIELQQINHMNSRSLDHKKDYSLRSLTFKIDLANPKKMMIDFNDNSSANNKPCGDKIKKAIEDYRKNNPE